MGNLKLNIRSSEGGIWTSASCNTCKPEYMLRIIGHCVFIHRPLWRRACSACCCHFFSLRSSTDPSSIIRSFIPLGHRHPVESKGQAASGKQQASSGQLQDTGKFWYWVQAQPAAHSFQPRFHPVIRLFCLLLLSFGSHRQPAFLGHGVASHAAGLGRALTEPLCAFAAPLRSPGSQLPSPSVFKHRGYLGVCFIPFLNSLL